MPSTRSSPATARMRRGSASGAGSATTPPCSCSTPPSPATPASPTTTASSPTSPRPSAPPEIAKSQDLGALLPNVSSATTGGRFVRGAGGSDRNDRSVGVGFPQPRAAFRGRPAAHRRPLRRRSRPALSLVRQVDAGDGRALPGLRPQVRLRSAERPEIAPVRLHDLHPHLLVETHGGAVVLLRVEEHPPTAPLVEVTEPFQHQRPSQPPALEVGVEADDVDLPVAAGVDLGPAEPGEPLPRPRHAQPLGVEPIHRHPALEVLTGQVTVLGVARERGVVDLEPRLLVHAPTEGADGDPLGELGRL